MDTYSEQLVKKTPTSSDGMKKIAVFGCGIALTAILVFLAFTVTTFILFAVALVIYGIYWLLTGMNIEYEYIVTNGSIDIDKIISQRKRVTLLSVDVKDFTEFDTYDNQPFDGTVYHAVGGECPLMYADFPDSQNGTSRLVFAPDEKTLECIKPYLRIRK